MPLRLWAVDHMDEKFMTMQQQLRNKLGPLPISSGVRCEKHNHDSGGYPKSAHLQSKGADIKIFGPRALALSKKHGGSVSLELGFHRRVITAPALFTWTLCPDRHYGATDEARPQADNDPLDWSF